jgi:hypothetical protein
MLFSVTFEGEKSNQNMDTSFCLNVSKAFLYHFACYNFCIFKVMAYIDVEVREIKQISGEKFVDLTNLKVKKLNKTTRGIVGHFVVKTADVGKNMQVMVEVWQKQGGEYRKLPYRLPSKNLCDFFNEDVVFMPEILEVSNISLPLSCPVPQVRSLHTFLSQNLKFFPNCR